MTRPTAIWGGEIPEEEMYANVVNPLLPTSRKNILLQGVTDRRFVLWQKSGWLEKIGEVDTDEQIAAERFTERPCLTCGQPFPSEGIHNRMCGKCKSRGGLSAQYG